MHDALDALAGQGDDELLEVCVRVTSEMCRLAGVNADVGNVLRSGAGRAKFEEMLRAQGGHLEEGLPVAPVQVSIPSDRDGYVEAIDALEVGLSAVDLGAGRLRKEDRIDHAAGFVLNAMVGDRVRKGDALVTVHAGSRELVDRVSQRVRNAWRISDAEVRRPPHVLARVDRNGVTRAD